MNSLLSSDYSNYQLDHLVAKDDSGAIFRAFDIARGEVVSFRKLFPFGAAGGGLPEPAQAAFRAAIEILKQVRHPNLRSVIDGGLDADGMPYMVAEWIDGASVQSFAERGRIDPGDFVNLVGKVLEVSELLSVALGKHGVWIETNLHTIGVGGPASGRDITFWITPIKWGGPKAASGLECVVSLIEDAMAWCGSAVPDHACNGLGGWLTWLRGVSSTTTLREARIHLKESIRVESAPERKTSFLPIPTRAPRPVHAKHPLGADPSAALNTIRRAPPVRIVVVKKPKGLSSFATGLIAVALVALAGWALIAWNNSRMPSPAAEVVALEDVSLK